MDKYEFKLRLEEIDKLMEKSDYKSAVKLADTIDWRRVKSVVTLVRIAGLYRLNKRSNECKDLLEMAYDRNPVSRNAIYGLCEICLERGELIAAIEYFKEYAKNFPNDSGVYILRYRIYEAQNVGFDDRIELLEELKKKDRMEEWEYQLAYLYHRAGYATKCVEECDELILWFGEGPFVTKAMELKMLHAPLTPTQQEKYDRRNDSRIEEAARAAMEKAQEEDEDDIKVKTIDMSKFNTMNLQAELAENLKEFMEEEPTPVSAPAQGYTAEPGENRGEKEVFHNTIPADANEIFFADKTEDIRYAVPFTMEQSGSTPEMELFKENFVQGMNGGGRDVSEIRFEEAAPVAGMVTGSMAAGAVTGSMAAGAVTGSMTGIAADEAGLSEQPMVEKQITGQMNLADFLSDWEQIKLANTQRFQEEVRQQILQHTGELFAEFNVNTQSGMLSALENPEKIDEVAGQASPVVMKGLDEQSVQSLAEAVSYETIHTETVVGVIGHHDTAAMAQILPGDVDEDVAIARVSGNAKEEMVDSDMFPGEITVDVQMPEAVAEEEEVSAAEITYEEEPAVEATYEGEPAAEITYEEESAVEATYEEEPAAENVYVEEPATESAFYGAVTEAIPGGIWKEVEEAMADDANAAERADNAEDRSTGTLRDEEIELFSDYLYSKKMKEQIAQTLDRITLAAYTGNVLISSESDESAVELAKQIVKFVQNGDGNFSGKVAIISAERLNKKSIPEVLQKLVNGALLIESASHMNKNTIKELLQGLNQENTGIVVILLDTRAGIQRLVDKIPYMNDFFNARIDIAAMSMEMLINYAVKYARGLEYTIDDMGHLALSKRLSDLKRGNHVITLEEVRDIVDEAIRKANKKRLFGKRRMDADGYYILREKDFE